jgi:hypothetical protein
MSGSGQEGADSAISDTIFTDEDECLLSDASEDNNTCGEGYGIVSENSKSNTSVN